MFHYLRSSPGNPLKKSRFARSDLIEPQLAIESPLASAYHHFLMKLDPMVRWSDIQPLPSRIQTQTKFVFDEQLVATVSPIFPSVLTELTEATLWGAMAAALGLRYAWTRLHMHIHVLNQLEHLLPGKQAIIEPGIGAGGLIHFLPTQCDLTYYGIDCSPQALDVCRHLEQAHELKGQRKLSRANFYALHADHLVQFEIDPRRTIVFFSNFLNNSNSIWRAFPCVEPAIVAAWLVSYWVNAGATVLVCERCDDPERFVRYLVENGQWAKDAKANLLDEFETYSTYESSIEKPVGQWRASQCVIASFQN